MRAQTIAQLSWSKPRSVISARLSSCDDIKGITGEQASDIIHYAECHKNLQFGWDFAVDAVNHNIDFPAVLHGDDLVVWKAYRYLQGEENSVISDALAINADVNANLKNQIKALLICDGVDHNYVAGKLSLPIEVVIAYEKLFFNILDRKDDHAFIASVVYPEGRMTEAFEDYLENTGLDDLLLRAGYSHGPSYVLYASGLGPHPFKGKNADAGAAMLDEMFMADGCLYAGLGWLHQRANAMPITNARLSMQATKMGNNDVGQQNNFISLGDSMRSQMAELGLRRAKSIAEYKAGEIVNT